MRLSGGRIAGLITAVVLGAMTPGASAAVTFNAAQPYPASAPWWIATGDVNGDGKLDVITASVSTDVISVLLGNGDGTLQPPLNTPAAPSFLDGVAADRAFLLEDGMHPNAAGIERMVERILPSMEQILAAKGG